jgi:hypothetical protein
VDKANYTTIEDVEIAAMTKYLIAWTKSLRKFLGWHTEEEQNAKLEGFAPGSFGCHEALHITSVVMAIVDQYICEHEAIKQNLEWFELAEKAREYLFQLYQDIGEKHL